MNWFNFHKFVFFALATTSQIFIMGTISPVNASSVQKLNKITPRQFTCMKNKQVPTILGTYRGEVKGKNKGKITIKKDSLWSSKEKKVADLRFKFNPSTNRLVLKLDKFYELGGDEDTFWDYASRYVINPCRK